MLTPCTTQESCWAAVASEGSLGDTQRLEPPELDQGFALGRFKRDLGKILVLGPVGHSKTSCSCAVPGYKLSLPWYLAISHLAAGPLCISFPGGCRLQNGLAPPQHKPTNKARKWLQEI